MGDRANVKIVNGTDAPVYLYTHWQGTRLPEIVVDALAMRARWDDPSYLARIVFCRMVDGRTTDILGYGIATSPPDNQHPIIVLRESRLRLENDDGSILWPPEGSSVSFEDILADPKPFYTAYREL